VAEKPITNASPQCATTRRVTALGALECVIATGVAWWIVWAYGVYVHLLIAISLAAPFLLRSPKSNAQSAALFQHVGTKLRSQFILWAVATLIASVISGGAIWAASKDWLNANWGPTLLSHPVILGWLFANAGHGACAAVQDDKQWTISGAAIITIACVLLSAIGALLAFHEVDHFTIGGVILGAAPVLFLGSYLLVRNPESEKDSWSKEFAAKEAGLAQFIVFTATSAGFFSGYVIRALLIGIFAILANLRDGIRSFSDNVHDTYLEDNVTTPPRLVSGLPQDHFINAVNLIRAFPLATLWGVGGAIGVCVLYLPWYIFRFVVKSAAWIYLPLLCAISILQATLSASGR